MISDFKIKLIQHSHLSNEMLYKIIDLKKQHWHYSNESHKKWIEENLMGTDYHLYIEDSKKELVAYMNLVNLDINIDGVNFSATGIGNVCTNKNFKGNGIGVLLMDIAKYYIKQLNNVAILLCKDNLVPFYYKSNWRLFVGESITILGLNYNNRMMFLDDKYINARCVNINRNF